MYVDSSTIHRKDKTYTRHLLRESYRDGGKVKHRTVANISSASPEEIQAIKLALKHKKNLIQLKSVNEIEVNQGYSFGAVWTLLEVAKRLQIGKVLGHTTQGKLALWQIIARTINQGSRLSAVRLASNHVCCELLGMDPFNEDDLYANLDWLANNQTAIQNKLFRYRSGQGHLPDLYLYDVTSSYLEGVDNDYAAFGYNRDGKRGKRQIVIGLLCDETGWPLSIEVFPGNTNDLGTFENQVNRVVDEFGGKSITFVGDRGMIKSPQIEQLNTEGLFYITAITKSQIQSMVKQGVFQLSLFDKDLNEVIAENGERFILRLNPIRAEEIRRNRLDKLGALQALVERYNQELAESSRTKVDVRIRYLETQAAKLRIGDWISIQADNRLLKVQVENEALKECEKLDGCYVLRTNRTMESISKEEVNSSYKNLQLVEQAFRTMKSVHLEMRPIYVRKGARTDGHALIVMLSYQLRKYLDKAWAPLNLTVEEGIQILDRFETIEMEIGGKTIQRIPAPNKQTAELLKLIDIKLPGAIPAKKTKVHTKKKLTRNP